MPARVIPGMSVDVAISPSGRYVIGCPDCDWFPELDPDTTVNRAEAKRLAYEHNVEKHDGAGVDVIPEDILTLKQKEISDARRQHRIHLGLAAALGGFALLAQWAAATSGDYDWFNVLSLGGQMFVIWYMGTSVGFWRLRLKEAVEELVQMTAQITEANRQARGHPESDG